MKTISHGIDNINKERVIIKKEPNGNSGVEKYNDWNFLKNVLEALNSRFELAEKRTSKLDRSIEIRQCGGQRENKMKSKDPQGNVGHL